MIKEIFRFSIIHNPQAISNERLKDSTIQIIEEEVSNYKIFSGLVKMRIEDKSLEQIKQSAKRAMQTNAFLKNRKQLRTKLFEFDDWMLTQKNIDVDVIITFSTQLFEDLKKFVESIEFQQDKRLIADSLIAASVVKPSVVGLRSRLMRLCRHIALLEYLAKEDGEKKTPKKVRKIRRATLLLPSQLFPLPNQNKERKEKNDKEQEKKRDALKKRIQEINDLNKKIEESSKAIDELSNAYSLHLLELKKSPKRREGKKANLSALPTDKFKALSNTTKDIISNKIGLKDDIVDIPYALEAIEQEITLQSKKINVDGFKDELMGVLDTFVLVKKKCGACEVVVVEEKKKENNFTGLTKGHVNNIGEQDLLMVRQELLDYEPGEIAHIENVLKGEFKSRQHRKLDRTEETVFEETEREEEFEKDLETTDRFELQSETSKTISRDVSKEAGITTSASYGPVKVEAHGNYASDTATETSRRSASNYSKDVVSRSVQKIKERVLQRRSKTTISEVEVINKHKIDNSPSETNTNNGHITGIYKWVNKLYQAQVFDYGKRGTLEFLIPEPAAFYRYAMSKKPLEGTKVPKPDEPGFCENGVFSKLKPTDLKLSNYMCFVSKYGVSDVTPPPPEFIVQSGAISVHFQAENSIQMAGDETKQVTIPSNYRAKSAEYVLAAGRSHESAGPGGTNAANFGVRVTCGNNLILSRTLTDQSRETDVGNVQEENEIVNGLPIITAHPVILNFDYNFDNELFLNKGPNEILLDNEEEEIELGIAYSADINFYAILNVAITCERKQEAFQQWQIDTYSAIINAYNGLKLDYEESLQAQSFETEINIQGQNPLINRETEKTELKKHAISILTGQEYEGFNAMWQNLNQGLGFPEIDLEDAKVEGQFVQFFEQAFEWQHATYLFYDYFWGRKDNWIDTLHLKDTDPLFEKFLKAGYARMWVPIRPGFQDVIGNYIESGGEPWETIDAPQPETDAEEDTLSQYPTVPLIEQLKEQMDNEFIERPGKIEAEKDSNEIQGKDGTDFTEDDIDREILIGLKSYRIINVDEANQKVTLNKPFPYDDGTFGVSLGATYVGESWVVELPTSLLWLDEESKLDVFKD
ncbi:hypothetical protein [Cyclobacterium sp. SYSU L10401]|uniref:hypothetical protein n=1 Tax=Cyclobacterium sp. SYSU L10401 TaxID=2678657 RepID=UPI0013D47E63|nr:hypothetical protein [Cyclobacterium sp. SYSU L10401]